MIFTAHSIPESMARVSAYEAQLREACQLVARQAGAWKWELAYQSRSGSPAQPWLGPDIGERLRAQESRTVVVAPIGFISDHMEVLYDLDIEARELAESLGITMIRAGTAGAHPAFVRMIQELVAERMPDRAGDGVCPPGCCPRAEARLHPELKDSSRRRASHCCTRPTVMRCPARLRRREKAPCRRVPG